MFKKNPGYAWAMQIRFYWTDVRKTLQKWNETNYLQIYILIFMFLQEKSQNVICTKIGSQFKIWMIVYSTYDTIHHN